MGSAGPTATEWDLISGLFDRGGCSSISNGSAGSLSTCEDFPECEGLELRRGVSAPAALQQVKRRPDRRRFCSDPGGHLDDASEAQSTGTPPSNATADLEAQLQRRGLEPVAERTDSFEARYSILLSEEVCGKGLMGFVRKARHKKTGQTVVVKKCRKSECSDATCSVLRIGARVHKELDHPNIVRLKDVYETDASLIQVMEYLSGDDLANALQKRGTFSESEAANVLRQVLQAVDYMHGRRAVHRDIKLDNLMFASPGSDVVKLIDLGMATSCDGTDRLTLQCGTVEYVAPEVLRGSYTEKVDLWSVGVVAYMLLTGEPLYSGTRWEIHAKALVGQPDIAAKLAGFSQNAQDFILQLLVSKPAQRISAEEALGHPWLS